MTGGRWPHDPGGSVTMTTPYGSSEPPFDMCALAATAGATYVARTLTSNPAQMTSYLKNALAHKGFSVVEILSQCPTHFGRYALGTGSPKALVDWIKERSIPAAAAEKKPEEAVGKYLLGEFVNIERPVFMGSTVYPAAGEEGSNEHGQDKHSFCGRRAGHNPLLRHPERGAVTRRASMPPSPSPTDLRRGGQCQSEVVLSKSPIGTPTSLENDILVAMAQSAFDSHKGGQKGGILFVDSGLVTDLDGLDRP